MKRLLITTLFFLAAVVYWAFSGNQHVDRDKYITQNILDISRPLNVTIDIEDVEFLQNLKPAYEQR